VGFFKRDNIKQAFEISGGKKGGSAENESGLFFKPVRSDDYKLVAHTHFHD
jgi:hypothetical protein